MKRLLGMGYRDPNGVRYVLGQIAEEQKQWPRGDRVVREHRATASSACRRACAPPNAMAKQGKLDEARALPAARRRRESRTSGCSSPWPRRSCCATPTATSDAFDLLGEALKKEPDQPELLYDYALTAEKLERFDVLESNLRKLIQVRPDHAHAYNALGYSFAERNMRLPEARKLIEKALELAPEDYFIIDSLGWVLYREGDLKGAARAAAARLRRAARRARSARTSARCCG